MNLFLLLIIFGLCSCSQQEPANHAFKIVEIAGRNEGFSLERSYIYRVKIPQAWVVQKPPADQSIADTTLAIVEFFINDDSEKIRIAIHNFPTNHMDQRIPPIVQINRWKQQFQALDQSSTKIEPQAFGGYFGLLFDASGQMKGAKTSILGWSLQLAPEHYRALSSHRLPATLEKKYKQMRSDVTIKAVGPYELMDKNREEIISFARSFQLIDEIP